MVNPENSAFYLDSSIHLAGDDGMGDRRDEEMLKKQALIENPAQLLRLEPEIPAGEQGVQELIADVARMVL